MPRPKGLPKTGGRKPGTPNKATADVKAVARRYTEEAIETLAQIMRSKSAPAIARAKAAAELLDRGHGRPTQAADLNVTGEAFIGPRVIEVVAGTFDPGKFPERYGVPAVASSAAAAN